MKLDYIDELIHENNEIISKLEEEKIIKSTFDEFISSDSIERERLLKQYNITGIAYKLDIISNYFYWKDLNNDFKFDNSLKNLTVEVRKIFDELISSIDSVNKSIVDKITEYKEFTADLTSIKEILKSIKEYKVDNYDKISEVYAILAHYKLKNDLLDDGKLCLLLSSISDYLFNLNNVNIETFEEKIEEEKPSLQKTNDDIKNKVIDIVNTLSDSNSKYYLSGFSYGEFNKEYLDDVKDIIKEGGYDSTNFILIVGIYINEILNNSNNEFYPELCKLIDMYKKSVDRKNEIDSKVRELSDKIESLDNIKSFYIDNLKSFLNDVKGNTAFLINDEYYRITIKQLSVYIQEIDKEFISEKKQRKPITTLNNFVLFARNENNNPYFLLDLFDEKRNLIDSRLSSFDYSKEYNDLLLDLFEYGEPSYMKSIDSKTSTGSDRVVMHIFNTTKKGEVDRKNPTDMWRVRPTLSSHIRFVERKIVIPRNKKIYKQVVEIVKKCLPHIKIDETKDFTFIVNMGTAVKKADVDLYQESIKRYDSNKLDIMQIFYVNDEYHTKRGATLKDEFHEDNEYDPMLLEDYIRKTIEILEYLEITNLNYQFSPLLGGDRRELSKFTY